MTAKECDNGFGRCTTMCGDPKLWFPMRVTYQREMKVKAERVEKFNRLLALCNRYKHINQWK